MDNHASRDIAPRSDPAHGDALAFQIFRFGDVFPRNEDVFEPVDDDTDVIERIEAGIANSSKLPAPPQRGA